MLFFYFIIIRKRARGLQVQTMSFCTGTFYTSRGYIIISFFFFFLLNITSAHIKLTERREVYRLPVYPEPICCCRFGGRGRHHYRYTYIVKILWDFKMILCNLKIVSKSFRKLTRATRYIIRISTSKYSVNHSRLWTARPNSYISLLSLVEN